VNFLNKKYLNFSIFFLILLAFSSVGVVSAVTGTIEFDQSGYYVNEYADYTGTVSAPSGWDSYRANLIAPGGSIVDFYDIPTGSLASFSGTFSIPLSYAGSWYVNLVSCPYGVCSVSSLTTTLSGMYVPVVAVGVVLPKAVLTYSTTSDYIIGTTFTYAVSYTNPVSAYVYQIRAENLYNGATIILVSEYGSALSPSGSFVIDPVNFEASTNYRLKVFELSTGSYIGEGNIFHVIAAATTDVSTLTVSPSSSYEGDYVTASGYAASIFSSSMKVVVYPATGTTEIQSDPVSGAYNINYLLPTGSYRAVLRELIPAGYSNAGQWQVILAAYFDIYTGDIISGKTLSISIIDPEGDNNGISETVMGNTLSFSYTNVTSTDRITISSPATSVFRTFVIGTTGSASESSGAYSFIVPNTVSSIGIWTVKIANGTNLADTATDTINIVQDNVFIDINNSLGSATIITPITIGCNVPATLKWTYTGSSSYNLTIYSLAPPTQYYNQIYSTTSGSMMYISKTNYYASINSMGYPLAVAYIRVGLCAGDSGGVNGSSQGEYQQPGSDGIDYVAILDSYVTLLGWGINSLSRLAFSIIVMLIGFAMGMLMFKHVGAASVPALGAFAIFTAIGYIPIWIIIVLVLLLASKVLR
jgi:hypothetical protein